MERRTFLSGFTALGATGLFVTATPANAAYDKRLAGFRADIAKNVAEKQRRVIEEGLILAESYYAKVLGLRLSTPQKDLWRLKVVATGKGNTERGGGGSCCTAFSQTHRAGPRLFIDVRHKHWANQNHPIYKGNKNASLKTMVHEFTHGIQMLFGTAGFNGHKLPNWMSEGMAEYFAYEAMFWQRKMGRRSVEKFMASSARVSDQMSMPLQRYSSGKHPWAGHIGYVAVVGLVKQSDSGLSCLFDYMRILGQGRRHSQAFETAFKISEKEFFARFEQYRQKNFRKSNPKAYWNN